jgi:hypothetical protein
MSRGQQSNPTSSTKSSRRQAPAERRGSASRKATTPSSRRTASRSDNRAPYLPTRREIARRCREIQAAWTPATRRLRDLYRVDPLVLAPVHVTFEADREQDAA